MTDEDEVLAANSAFYAAFGEADADAMDRVWARRAPCACVHPGWDALIGRDRVMESWRRMFDSGGAPPITCGGAVAHLFGESAYVICLEKVPGATLVATNVFCREDGRFRLVHHHAGPVSPPTPVRQRTDVN